MKNSDNPKSYNLNESAKIGGKFRSILKDLTGRHVNLTNKGGKIVGKIEVGKLERQLFSTNRGTELGSDLFTHLQIDNQESNKDILILISEIQSYIAKLDPEIGCIFDEISADLNPCFQWVIFGPSGQLMDVHQDMYCTSSWNYMIVGQKLWEFWEPHDDPRSRVAGFSITQNPNELVWIPEGWWHRVSYQLPSIAVSKNLIRKNFVADIKRLSKDADNKLHSALSIYKRIHMI